MLDITAPEIIPIKLKPLPKDLKLREAQEILFRNLEKSYKAGHRKQAVMAPTGAGKSLWAAVLFHRILSKKPDAKLLFVVPRTTLIKQIVDDFEYVLQAGISVIQGHTSGINLSLPVQVATIQTLGNRIRDYPRLFSGYDCVVIDEMHLKFKAVETIDTKWLIGLSATPFSKGLGNLYTDLIRTKTAHQLSIEGIITPMKVKAAVKQIDPSKLKVLTTGEYSQADEDAEVDTLTGDVLKEYQNDHDMEGRQFLGFAKSIKSCVKLAEIFQDAGINVAYVHSKMKDEDIEAILDAFKAGLYVGVWSVVKLIEGYSYPKVSATLLCTSFAPSKDNPNTPAALGKWIQIHGRSRRRDKDDPHKVAVVLDFGNNWTRYSHPDVYEAEFTELCTGKKKEVDNAPKASDIKETECCECHHFHTGRTCNYCGHQLEKHTEFVDGEIVKFENGKMVEIVPRKVTKQKDKQLNKQTIYSGILHEIMQMNIKRKLNGKPPVKTKGMAAHAYRRIFGVWPKGLAYRSEYNLDAHNYWVASRIRYMKGQAKESQAATQSATQM